MPLAAAEPAADPPAAAAIEVGFGGVYKTGFWTPLRSNAGRADPRWLWADDPDDSPVGIAAIPAAEGGAPVQPGVAPARSDPSRSGPARSGPEGWRGTVRFGRPQGRVGLSADASGADTRVIELPPPLPGHAPLVVVAGKLRPIRRACQLLERPDGTRPTAVEVPLAGLDGDPLDLDAADALVVCGTSLASRGGRGRAQAVDVVDAWVRRGGHMLLLAGESAVALEACGPPLSAWLPGRTRATQADPTAGLAPLRRFAAVELFAKAARPLSFAPTQPPRVPVFRDPVFQAGEDGLWEDGDTFDGTILLHEGQNPTALPLVTRRAHGLGTITWVGLDLDAAPFADWSGSESFLARLLADRFAAPIRLERPVMPAAAGDLAGQLRRAVDTFPNVSPVPFGIVAILVIGHVAMLYPVSWWVACRLTASRWRGHEVAAWLLLPFLVALFSCGSMLAGGFWSGWKPTRSGCGVADVDVAGGQVRIMAFAGIWSPENGRCSVAPAASLEALAICGGESFRSGEPTTRPDESREFRPPDSVAPSSVVVSWFADAGRSLGGSDATTPHPSLAADRYHCVDGAERLVDVPIAAASSRLFEARIDRGAGGIARGDAALFEGRLDREPQGTLRGRLVSHLPFPLERCQLAYSGWVYTLGTLASDGSFDPAETRGPTSLAASLTRRIAAGDHDAPVAYDRDARDPWRILEVAGFFAAAGSESYAGLPAGRLGRLDMSPLIEANRAVLSGEGPAVATWTIDGPVPPRALAPGVSPSGTARGLWRFVLPLGRSLGSSSPRRIPAP